MPANVRPHSSRCFGRSEQPVLCLALELGWDSWKLAFASGPGPAPRLRQMPARDVCCWKSPKPSVICDCPRIVRC
jgi:hypothetical protein